MQAIVYSLYVDVHHAVKIGFAGVFSVANVGNPGVVDQNVQGSNFLKNGFYLGLIADVTGIGVGLSTLIQNTLYCCLCGSFIQVQDVHLCPLLGKYLGNRQPNSASSSGDGRLFVV